MEANRPALTSVRNVNMSWMRTPDIESANIRHLVFVHLRPFRFLFALAIVLISSWASPPAIGQTPKPQMRLFQGTPTQQAACNADALRLCTADIPDRVRVLTCLRNFRKRLSPICLQGLDQAGL